MENEIKKDNVNELISKANELMARVQAIEKKITDKNYQIFIKEVRNLLNGVGEGYIAEDYYSSDRYYSDIEGVKNIRLLAPEKEGYEAEIMVKVTSPKGYLIPKEIQIDGKKYYTAFIHSKNYNSEIDY